jgi:hypothetical protein
MIIIFQKSTGGIVGFGTNPTKFRMKLENRVFPKHELAAMGSADAVPDDQKEMPGAPVRPKYNYSDIAKKYDSVEITDKPTARKIRTDPTPVLVFSGDVPVSVTLSTGESIAL